MPVDSSGCAAEYDGCRRHLPAFSLTGRLLKAIIEDNTQMQALSSISMACLLFLQAVSGCCWQRECVDGAATITPPTKRCADDCHDTQHSQKPCEGKLECHGVCTYLMPERTLVDSSDGSVSLDVVFLPALASSHVTLSVASGWVFAHGPSTVEPPVRLHLFHQVLLI